MLERFIDRFTGGLISKDQFTSRLARTRSRVAELDAEIQAYPADIDQMEHLRLAVARLRELWATIGPDLVDADWHRQREVIRTLSPDRGRSGLTSVAVTLPRCP